LFSDIGEWKSFPLVSGEDREEGKTRFVMNKGKKKSIGLPLAIPPQSTSVNKTGTWRYATPVFLERVAPCNEACPAGEDIDKVMFLHSQGRFIEAYQKIREENPFPGICGRICLHPCEKVCNRHFFDEAVSIRALERFASDYAKKKGFAPGPPLRRAGKKVAIVGSGPAGLSCAYFLIRLGYGVTLFEKEERPGGMLRRAIPEYRLPKNILDWEVEQVLSMGVTLRLNTHIGEDLSIDDLKKFRAVFVAPGASFSARVPGMERTGDGVDEALTFLRHAKEGRLPVLSGRVVIVGGGNTAVDAARVALRLGGEPVILYRRSQEEMPASEEEIVQAEKEGIGFHYLTGVTGVIEGSEKGKTVSCIKMRLGEIDETGRKSFHPLKDSSFEMRADHIILAVGQKTDLSFLPRFIRIKEGLIAVGPSLETTKKGVFAGGDAVSQPRTVVHAIASGKRAALSIDSFLKKRSLGPMEGVAVGMKGALSMNAYEHIQAVPVNRLMKEVVPYESLNLDYFKKSPRSRLSTISAQRATKSFQEVEKGLSHPEAIRSAKRCFNCGICCFCSNCYEFCPDLAIHLDDRKMEREIDYDHCKGCGICIEECPRAAIGWEQKI